MENNPKQGKTQQVRDILTLYFIEKATFEKITEQVGVSRPTARKYIDKFKEIVSDEDFALKDTFKDLKRKKSFPVSWNKYVKTMLKDFAKHPKTVATPVMKKKIIKLATIDDQTYKTAMDVYNELREMKGKTPSYETVAIVLKEYFGKRYKEE